MMITSNLEGDLVSEFRSSSHSLIQSIHCDSSHGFDCSLAL